MSEHLSMEVRVPIDADNPSIGRIEERCIFCKQCKDVCTDYIAVMNTYTLEETNDRAICIHCGQCANVCPVDCIVEKYEYEDVKKAINDPDKIVIFNTSPSVRIALGEEFDMPLGSFVQGKMVALLRKLGVDYVLDTNFGADMTIMEEASELVHRLKTKDSHLPQYTSCCPAWVKFAEIYYPELLPYISTSKSPIGMQGPTVKTYFAQKMGIDPRKIVNVCVTPCTAKKFEIRREEMCDASKRLNIPGMRDMDHVITTRELAMWAKENGIDFKALEDSDYDDYMGQSSGAGAIFANSGGVMEAAVRTAYELMTGVRPPDQLYHLKSVRGLDGIKEATLTIGNNTVSLAVIYGTANVRQFLEQQKQTQKHYDFVEVMACPGGCIGGGGQPKSALLDGQPAIEKRNEGIYNRDSQMQLRNSHDNPQIKKLYDSFYIQPLSPLAEDMLHTTYHDRSQEPTKN